MLSIHSNYLLGAMAPLAMALNENGTFAVDGNDSHGRTKSQSDIGGMID